MQIAHSLFFKSSIENSGVQDMGHKTSENRAIWFGRLHQVNLHNIRLSAELIFKKQG